MHSKEENPLGPQYLLAIANSAPFLTEEQESKLARAALAGNERAFDRLLTAHLRLVLSLAHDFASYGLPLDELVSEGMLGLVEAARRFDPERGVRLAAYAAWWIRAYMRRYTIANRRIVRTPSSRHGRKLLAKLRQTQRELAQQKGEQPNAEDVANALGVGVRDVHEMESALSGRDLPCGHDADGWTLDLAGDDPTPEAAVADQEEWFYRRAAVDNAMGRLNQREQHIVEKRYLTEERRSLASIGRDMGLSRERVRQLEHQAQAKMRDAILASVA